MLHFGIDLQYFNEFNFLRSMNDNVNTTTQIIYCIYCDKLAFCVNIHHTVYLSDVPADTAARIETCCIKVQLKRTNNTLLESLFSKFELQTSKRIKSSTCAVSFGDTHFEKSIYISESELSISIHGKNCVQIITVQICFCEKCTLVRITGVTLCDVKEKQSDNYNVCW